LKDLLMLAQRKLIAVVDDDPNMLKAVARLLKFHGFDVEVFTSAEAFLDSGVADKASCLVLDIYLGGISGFELGRQLMASNCTLPIIFMTAADDETTRRNALASGCIAYLRKPFEARLLIGAIQQAR
jgi:FixJ family two-component response regulator